MVVKGNARLPKDPIWKFRAMKSGLTKMTSARTKEEFETEKYKVFSICPLSFIDYFNANWTKNIESWAGYFRTGLDMFRKTDTLRYEGRKLHVFPLNNDDVRRDSKAEIVGRYFSNGFSSVPKSP